MRIGAAFAAAVAATTMFACSEKNSTQAVPRREPTRERSLTEILGSAHLREIHSFEELPNDVQSLASNGFMTIRLDNQKPEFVVGGTSDSAAIVAYTVGGYVPELRASAYIQSKSGWVNAADWIQLRGSVENLQDLLKIVGVTHH